ncbi:hypothetical protein FRUB_10017 [Fimbriiglobus ruber]|uniref:Uncharacterized protein n=2 Tax=Fimbriiglobus ruber TaxID=1908690 RepID=A0A225DFK3_9BACT|nr:hypothetical protein FRUB_10017 [Fimbriiglobus ruber]
MAKVYRLADELAEKQGVGPLAHGNAKDLAAAASELDVVIAWCATLAEKAEAV